VVQIGELLESIAISVINCVCGVELCSSDWRATGVYCNQCNKLCAEWSCGVQIGELLESIAISVINCVCGGELCGSD
jgi:hypothetical protein